MSLRWQNVETEQSTIANGIRQGVFLSPYLSDCISESQQGHLFSLLLGVESMESFVNYLLMTLFD